MNTYIILHAVFNNLQLPKVVYIAVVMPEMSFPGLYSDIGTIVRA